MEKHDQQFSLSAATRGSQSSSRSTRTLVNEPETAVNKHNVSITNPSPNPVCFNCYHSGHIARNCRKPRPNAEAVGRQKVLSLVAEISDEQLQVELASRKLARKEQLLQAAQPSIVNMVEGASGPTLVLDIQVEGLNATAVVDTASNSTIISQTLLHDIKFHLRSMGNPVPKLERPCLTLERPASRHRCPSSPNL